MALPNDDDIQIGLLRLLRGRGGKMDSRDVYRELARGFPQITRDELNLPYANSVSHWANRVQWSVQHLRDERRLQHTSIGGRGVWVVSEEGRAYLAEVEETGDRLIAELLAI